MKDVGFFGGLSRGVETNFLKELSRWKWERRGEDEKAPHTHTKKKEREMTTRSKASSKAAVLGGILNSTGDGWVRYEPWELEGDYVCMYPGSQVVNFFKVRRTASACLLF